jgi:hypothetical protein
MKPRPEGIRDECAPQISRIKVIWALFVEAVLVTALFVASVVISACISKADNVDWEAIAQCESGGKWAASNGGGLQISQASWDADGVVETPASASPPQQIKVADKIMATRGPSAWPKCGSCRRDESPVGSLTHVLKFLEIHSGGCVETNDD